MQEKNNTNLERMRELIEQLTEADIAYYKNDAPIMTDLEYDRLTEELAALEHDTGLVLSGSPTQKVSGEILESLAEVRHTKPMLSAGKTKSIEDLIRFAAGRAVLMSWKMDGLITMNIEEVLSTTHRISPRERVPFHCTCCGECCRHVRQSVPLESPDVFRLTRLLREKDKGIICMDDFIARYTELALLDECGYFMLMLKVTGVDDACIFLKENRCMVHAAKPRTCRIYPFVAGIGDDGQPEYLVSREKEHHFKGPAVHVKAWMKRRFTEEDKAFLRMDLGSARDIARLMRRIPEFHRQQAMLLFWRYKYSDFDLDQPFLTQYAKNLQQLKAALSLLAEQP